MKLNNQKASGYIDWLIEMQDGYILIDHKSFPGREELWPAKAASYLPQLKIYAKAIEEATGKLVLEAWIHLQIVGKLVHFGRKQLAFGAIDEYELNR